MKIQGIKLVTGEELVAKVVSETPGGQITVNSPLMLRVGQGPEGFVVNFFPWTIIADGDIRIEGHAIVAAYDVPKDVEDSYIQNTTGLQVVSGTTSQLLQG